MEKLKVLFIEDDAFLARIYTQAIEEASYEAILASTGEEGLKLAEREKPAIILLTSCYRIWMDMKSWKN